MKISLFCKNKPNIGDYTAQFFKICADVLLYSGLAANNIKHTTKISRPVTVLLLAAVICFVFSAAVMCDKTNFTHIDQYVEKTPESAEISVKELAAYLSASAKNDTEKTRAIYSWIVNNIEYDAAAYKANKMYNQEPEAVLKSRKGVCAGYATLFKELATAAGLKSVIIEGFSRGKNFKSNTKLTKKDHAWNAVMIGGEWKFVDCVWAAGYLDDNDVFVHNRCDYYFFTPPNQFIYDHFPEEVKWQLLDNPISKTDYEQMVTTKPPFFRNRLKLISHTNGLIKSENKCAITLSSPDDVLLMADICSDNQKVDNASVFMQKNDDMIELNALFPNAGNYNLRIFAKRKSDPGLYELAAEYVVQVTSYDADLKGFPTALSTFQEKNAYLYAPLSGCLKASSNETFRISAPGAADVAVIVNGSFIHLAKNGDVFEGNATITGDDVKVAVRFPGEQSYKVLLKYSVS